MRLMRHLRNYFELIKAINRIIAFFWSKCWHHSIVLTIFVIISYLTLGFGVSFLVWIFGSLYIIYKICDWLLYHPNDPSDSRVNVMLPSSFKLPFESHTITTSDNVNINVMLIKQPEERFSSQPTVIYFHGNAGNIGHRLTNAYEMYHKLGCNILLVEYRGYGLSQGNPSENGLYLDAQAALKFILEYPGLNHSQIIVFGRSLGGAVAIDLTAKLNQHIRALIVENTFLSIPDIAHVLFNLWLVRIIPTFFYKNTFNSVMKINQITIPTLFISGLCDELIPSCMMQTLYMLSSSVNKQLHTFECGTHNFTWRCKDYYSVMNNFIYQSIHNQVLDENTPSALHQHHHQHSHAHRPQMVLTQDMLLTEHDTNQVNIEVV